MKKRLREGMFGRSGLETAARVIHRLATCRRARDRAFKESCLNTPLESLILAQDERWRRA
jgi:hypothetical protein